MLTGDLAFYLWLDDKGRMSGDVHVRICESVGVRFPSATRLELVMATEEEFGIEISDEDAERMKRVRDVIRYLEDKIHEH